jgi:hypothetical protein
VQPYRPTIRISKSDFQQIAKKKKRLQRKDFMKVMHEQLEAYIQSRLSSTSEYWIDSQQHYTTIGTLKHILMEQISNRQQLQTLMSALHGSSKTSTLQPSTAAKANNESNLNPDLSREQVSLATEIKAIAAIAEQLRLLVGTLSDRNEKTAGPDTPKKLETVKSFANVPAKAVPESEKEALFPDDQTQSSSEPLLAFSENKGSKSPLRIRAELVSPLRTKRNAPALVVDVPMPVTPVTNVSSTMGQIGGTVVRAEQIQLQSSNIPKYTDCSIQDLPQAVSPHKVAACSLRNAVEVSEDSTVGPTLEPPMCNVSHLTTQHQRPIQNEACTWLGGSSAVHQAASEQASPLALGHKSKVPGWVAEAEQSFQDRFDDSRLSSMPALRKKAHSKDRNGIMVYDSPLQTWTSVGENSDKNTRGSDLVFVISAPSGVRRGIAAWCETSHL